MFEVNESLLPLLKIRKIEKSTINQKYLHLKSVDVRKMKSFETSDFHLDIWDYIFCNKGYYFRKTKCVITKGINYISLKLFN